MGATEVASALDRGVVDGLITAGSAPSCGRIC